MTTTSNQDELVQELLKKVQEKKKTLEEAVKPNWLTGGIFGFSANSAHDRSDIKLIVDTGKLVEMYGFLITRKEKADQAAKELDVVYNFKWLGFTADEWKNDIQARINQLQLHFKRSALADLESRLNAQVSPELRSAMELEAIGAALEL
ncbi:MAG TPA: hypothetical protein VGM30_24860 [Puia sp.]|jgi:hypothetical protein